MVQQELPLISVQTAINASVEDVWERWTNPDDITQWNSASASWHTPKAVIDLREGGRFCFRMEALDGKEGFDITGTFYDIVRNEFIGYTLDDGRKVEVEFLEVDGKTVVEEVFEAETINTIEQQREGWQAILDNFKRYMDSFNR